MRNFASTLHGGLCATILDQAMGFLAYCLKPGEGMPDKICLSGSGIYFYKPTP